MHIDWSAAGISNHQQLALLEIVRAIPADPSFDYVLPLEGGAKVIRVARHNAGTSFDGKAVVDYFGDPRTACAIDYDEEQTLLLDYHYRNAGGSEISGNAWLRGRITPTEHAILLTALSGAEMGCFIPSQIGLEDLQHQADWDLDFEDHDHVWHSFERLVRADEEDGQPVKGLIDACRTRLAHPWDDHLAMQQHLGIA